MLAIQAHPRTPSPASSRLNPPHTPQPPRSVHEGSDVSMSGPSPLSPLTDSPMTVDRPPSRQPRYTGEDPQSPTSAAAARALARTALRGGSQAGGAPRGTGGG
ncbi:hypothetical protein BV20DRAFT_324283 [Pilatotrama ljubarskyi]|nr:hypothetical protein BV20DRAFT_324283 [Pilatotrama ljubarskyi]